MRLAAAAAGSPAPRRRLPVPASSPSARLRNPRRGSGHRPIAGETSVPVPPQWGTRFHCRRTHQSKRTSHDRPLLPRAGRTLCTVRHAAPDRVLPCLPRAEPCGTRQSKQAFTADQQQMTQMDADGPDSGTVVHGRHRAIRREEPHRGGGHCPSRVRLPASAAGPREVLACFAAGRTLPRGNPSLRARREPMHRNRPEPRAHRPVADPHHDEQDPMHQTHRSGLARIGAICIVTGRTPYAGTAAPRRPPRVATPGPYAP